MAERIYLFVALRRKRSWTMLLSPHGRHRWWNGSRMKTAPFVRNWRATLPRPANCRRCVIWLLSKDVIHPGCRSIGLRQYPKERKLYSELNAMNDERSLCSELTVSRNERLLFEFCYDEGSQPFCGISYVHSEYISWSPKLISAAVTLILWTPKYSFWINESCQYDKLYCRFTPWV